MATEHVQYAWFSHEAANNFGHTLYRKADGNEIVVTYVSDNPPLTDIQPGYAHMPPSYGWSDTIYQGEVVAFARSFVQGLPQ